MSFRNDSNLRSDAELGEEAAEWLLCFADTGPDPQHDYPDEKTRNQAFYEWIETSPEHLRVFMETAETHQRMRLIDERHEIRIKALLRQRADVIQLHREKPARHRHRPDAAAREKPVPMWPSGFAAGLTAKRVALRVIAAVVLVCAPVAAGYWWSSEQNVYTTRIGEQRSTKLEDGSFIYMNTDSEVEVDFSRQARNVRLVRGEALFIVERDSSRPFTVTAGDTSVRALGTQFNVRRHAEGAEVAVVEGTVQVTAMYEQAGFPAQKLVAGEQAQVIKGKIAPRNHQTVAETLTWRQRRLVFHDAPLAGVAAEFNRYNVTKIRIEGDAAKETLLSGIFDADRPQALILYLAKSSEFAVEPVGNDWLIRGR
jgi:transmembrane sensor